MGYYGPSFANLESGWYLTTSEANYAPERDQCLTWWNEECDAILAQHLTRHGMFVSAFEKDIRADIRMKLKGPLTFPRYFGYFFISRILSNADLAAIYRRDYRNRATEKVQCVICGTVQTYDDIDPSIIGRARKVLPLCNDCGFWVGRMAPLDKLTSIPPDLIERVGRLSKKQSCALCHREFVWLRKRVRYSFEVPLLPAKHIEICPRCVEKALLVSYSKKSEEAILKQFREIAELLGAIPDRSGFIYDQAPDLETAVKITRLMHSMPTFDDLIKRYGSWLKLLIVSGVLPGGTRRTKFGTMVVALDGHDCRSLAEKSIDDLLHKHSIPHEREPTYPGTSFRADWRLIVGDEIVLVEFFGLDSQHDYAKRMEEKLDYAKRHGIRVIAFVPKDLADLREAFSQKILQLFPEKTGVTARE